MDKSNKSFVTKDDINIAWENKMERSHCNPKMRKSYMKRNKYYRTKLRTEKLISIFRFRF